MPGCFVMICHSYSIGVIAYMPDETVLVAVLRSTFKLSLAGGSDAELQASWLKITSVDCILGTGNIR